MARIRTIKPEFFTSEDIVNLSPLARLLYVALWCEADREGRMAWKPKTFKMRYLPGDSCNIDKLCCELLDAGLVVQYGQYAFIPSFHAHQHINPREAASQLPEPNLSTETTRAPRVSDASTSDVHTQVGREGKGKEGKGKEHAARFDEFWDAWPKNERKQDKSKCSAKWATDKLDLVADSIISDIDVKRRTDKWKAGYVEAPLVYLNNRRWEDGVVPSEGQPAASIDPDSRAAIEAEGIAKGIGPWNEGMEQWHVYKAKVRGRGEPALNITQLAQMAKRRAA